MDMYQKYPQYWDKVTVDTLKYYKDFLKCCSTSFLGAYYAAFNDINDKDAVAFMDKLTTGIGITSPKDPVGILRNHFMKERTAHKKNTPEYHNAVMRKAWNAFRDKKAVNVLTFRKGEAMPELV